MMRWQLIVRVDTFIQRVVIQRFHVDTLMPLRLVAPIGLTTYAKGMTHATPDHRRTIEDELSEREPAMSKIAGNHGSNYTNSVPNRLRMVFRTNQREEICCAKKTYPQCQRKGNQVDSQILYTLLEDVILIRRKNIPSHQQKTNT